MKTSHKEPTRADATRTGHGRKNMGNDSLSHIYSATSESSGKRRKRYVDHPKGESKTCLINGPSHK